MTFSYMQIMYVDNIHSPLLSLVPPHSQTDPLCECMCLRKSETLGVTGCCELLDLGAGCARCTLELLCSLSSPDCHSLGGCSNLKEMAFLFSQTHSQCIVIFSCHSSVN